MGERATTLPRPWDTSAYARRARERTAAQRHPRHQQEQDGGADRALDRAFADRARRLGDVKPTVRKATASRSMRLTAPMARSTRALHSVRRVFPAANSERRQPRPTARVLPRAVPAAARETVGLLPAEP